MGTESSDDSDDNEQKKENKGIEPGPLKRGPLIIDSRAKSLELKSESSSESSVDSSDNDENGQRKENKGIEPSTLKRDPDTIDSKAESLELKSESSSESSTESSDDDDNDQIKAMKESLQNVENRLNMLKENQDDEELHQSDHESTIALETMKPRFGRLNEDDSNSDQLPNDYNRTISLKNPNLEDYMEIVQFLKKMMRLRGKIQFHQFQVRHQVRLLLHLLPVIAAKIQQMNRKS